jgi:hypothetical protein
MSRFRAKWSIAASVLLGAIIIVWADTRKPPVSLTVVRLVATDLLIGGQASQRFASAVIGVTNNTTRPFTYHGYDSPDSAIYGLLEQTPSGWQEARSRFVCAAGVQTLTLEPGHGFTFQVTVRADKPCKVTLNYFDTRKPNPMWQRSPPWLVSRLPWLAPWRTAVSDPINLNAT